MARLRNTPGTGPSISRSVIAARLGSWGMTATTTIAPADMAAAMKNPSWYPNMTATNPPPALPASPPTAANPKKRPISVVGRDSSIRLPYDCEDVQ